MLVNNRHFTCLKFILSMILDTKLVLKEMKNSYALDPTELLYLVKYDRPIVIPPVPLTEKILVAKLKIGDESAFSWIFRAYYKDLVLFASRFTNDPEQSEEIVQDTFVRLWEDHDLINITVSIKSYLIRSVQNKCIDWQRHQKIRKIYFNSTSEVLPGYISDTEKYILYSELQDRIDSILAKIPDEISNVFRMSRYKGLKYYEIADEMGVSVRTVEVRIGKVLNILRKHLKDYLVLLLSIVFLAGLSVKLIV